MDIVRTNFPPQAIPEIKKTKEWYKKNADAIIGLMNSGTDNSFRLSLDEKISCRNFVNGEISKEEILGTLNPNNFSIETNLDNYRNYPIVNSSLNFLYGERRKRIYEPIAYAIKSEEINTELDGISLKFKNLMTEVLMSQSMSEEQINEELKRFDRWSKYTYVDHHTRMANDVIKYFLKNTDLKEQFNKAFEDLLTYNEEIINVDILGGGVICERINPEDFYAFMPNDSYKSEDADVLIIIKRLPIGTVIDRYHDFLSKEDRACLQEEYLRKTPSSASYPNGQILNEVYDINSVIAMQSPTGDDCNVFFEKKAKNNTRLIDNNGNVLAITTMWKGQRRIGFLEYRDLDGTIQKKYVSEHYTPNKELGENIKYEYLSEWYECTKMGNIYLKYGAKRVQFRDSDNPSICLPGIVANNLNVNSSRSKSLVGQVKPYQILYNFYMYRLQQDMIKYQGHIARFNLATKPDKWSVEKVMYYMQKFGVYVEDPFNEGQEGAAQGKLAGGLGHNPGSLQIGDFNLITMNIKMLEFIESKIDDITGISPQRKGAVGSRETVGGVQRSIEQSSNNTEKYFSVDDNFRDRVLATIIETVKIAWKDKKEKRAYLMDNGTRAILDFDGSSFSAASYGIAIDSSSEAINLTEQIKQIQIPYLQNQGSLSLITELINIKDPTEIKRKIEQHEYETEQRRAEEAKLQTEQIDKEIEANERIRKEEMEHERLLKELQINADIKMKLMEVDSNKEQLLKENESDYDRIKRELFLKEKAINETIRHNKVTETINSIKKRQK